ncbi:MAG TPA: hypothetical protein VHR66_30080 [Gemmataceae bacterium]|jgi:hypothetical protein|nr:hypothetical protein [Gemmataceae bacterium]
MFTIEVSRKAKDDVFSVETLAVFHQECLGGQIKVIPSGDDYFHLDCTRCKDRRLLICGEKTTAMIAKTAIDGATRDIPSLDGGTIMVSQKQ